MAAASLTACGGDTTSTPAATQEAAKTETPAAGGEAASGDVKKITEAIAEGPIILTSVGQSADVNVVQTLLKKCEIDSDLNATVTADDLGSYKTLVLAIGGSSKGPVSYTHLDVYKRQIKSLCGRCYRGIFLCGYFLAAHIRSTRPVKSRPTARGR